MVRAEWVNYHLENLEKGLRINTSDRNTKDKG